MRSERSWKIWGACLGGILFLGALIPGPGRAERDRAAGASGPIWSDDRLVDPVSYHGQTARGLYFTGPYLRLFGAEGAIKTLRGTDLNAAVVDLKDGQGRVTYDTRIEVLQPQKQVFLQDAPALLQQLRDAGVYTIGRIVCFSDPSLPSRHPERAVMDNRPHREGKLWASWGGRNTWLDPYNEANHDLIVALAKEAEALGVDEVQLDYFRFPVDEATRFARFPAEIDRPRREVLLGLLRRIDRALSIPLGVDVFGLTAFRHGDPAGLGQSLNDWALHLEVFSPMLYANNMTHWMRGETQRALKLVSAGVRTLRNRLGHGPIIRPFLQAFSAGADYYNAAFIREQIVGARRAEGDGFLFWHPASNYGLVRGAMAGGGRALVPFPVETRFRWRAQAWADGMTPPDRTAYLRQLQGDVLAPQERVVEAEGSRASDAASL